MNWLIWSNEHNAWWAPDSMGYTKDRNKAGRYPMDKAIKIVMSANKHNRPDEKPDESIVPELEKQKGE